MDEKKLVKALKSIDREAMRAENSMRNALEKVEGVLDPKLYKQLDSGLQALHNIQMDVDSALNVDEQEG